MGGGSRVGLAVGLLHSNEAIAGQSPKQPSAAVLRFGQCQQRRAISLQFVRHVTARNPAECWILLDDGQGGREHFVWRGYAGLLIDF